MQLEDKKKELEIEKLAYEVKKLRYPHKFLSTYVKALTIVLQISTGLIAIVFAYQNGWFSIQNETLALKKMNLEYDIKKFADEKRNIIDSINRYRTILQKTISSNKNLLAEREKLLVDLSNANESMDYIDSIKLKAHNDSSGGNFFIREGIVKWYISGRVRDNSHNKIVNAAVILDYENKYDNSPQKQVVYSDSVGKFKIMFTCPLHDENCFFKKWKNVRLTIEKKGYISTYVQFVGITSHETYPTYFITKIPE